VDFAVNDAFYTAIFFGKGSINKNHFLHTN